MLTTARQKVLRHLGALSVTVGAGCAVPSAELLRVPAEVVVDLVDEAEDSSWRGEDKRALLGLFAQDPRASIRARVAESAWSLANVAKDDMDALLAGLAQDESKEVQWAAARSLARAIEQSAPVDRLQTMCRWATSESVLERIAIARALSQPMPILAADLALTTLATDEDARVRRHAARAVVARFDESPDIYRRLATDLAADTDSRVRRAARRALRSVV